MRLSETRHRLQHNAERLNGRFRETEPLRRGASSRTSPTLPVLGDYVDTLDKDF